MEIFVRRREKIHYDSFNEKDVRKATFFNQVKSANSFPELTSFLTFFLSLLSVFSLDYSSFLVTSAYEFLSIEDVKLDGLTPLIPGLGEMIEGSTNRIKECIEIEGNL